MSKRSHRAKEAKRRFLRFMLIAGVLAVGAVYFEYKLTHVAELAVICEAVLGALEG